MLVIDPRPFDRTAHELDRGRRSTGSTCRAARGRHGRRPPPALLRWKVLFLRGQHLTPTEQVRLRPALRLLTPAHPLQGGFDDEHPEVLVLDSRDYAFGIGDRDAGDQLQLRWHTDVTFSADAAGGVDPRRRGGLPPGRRRHAVGRPRRRLRVPVAGVRQLARSPGRGARRPAAPSTGSRPRRRQPATRVDARGPRPATPSCGSTPRPGAGPVRQPGVHVPHRRPVPASRAKRLWRSSTNTASCPSTSCAGVGRPATSRLGQPFRPATTPPPITRFAG